MIAMKEFELKEIFKAHKKSIDDNQQGDKDVDMLADIDLEMEIAEGANS